MLTSFLKIIRKIVKATGKLEEFENEEHFHIRIPNEPYMDLVIESWDSPLKGEGRRISVVHYYEQNGDLVPVFCK